MEEPGVFAALGEEGFGAGAFLGGRGVGRPPLEKGLGGARVAVLLGEPAMTGLGRPGGGCRVHLHSVNNPERFF